VLHTEAIGRENGAPLPATVAANAELSNLAVPAGASGTLDVTVADDSAKPLPARILIEQTGHDRRVEWTTASGHTQLALEPGTWRVSISRGIEYGAFVGAAVTIADGQTTPLVVTLDHVVDTAGWISLDTHLHSELSTDSTFPIDDRIRG